jgi:hypothetical protein
MARARDGYALRAEEETRLREGREEEWAEREREHREALARLEGRLAGLEGELVAERRLREEAEARERAAPDAGPQLAAVRAELARARERAREPKDQEKQRCIQDALQALVKTQKEDGGAAWVAQRFGAGPNLELADEGVAVVGLVLDAAEFDFGTALGLADDDAAGWTQVRRTYVPRRLEPATRHSMWAGKEVEQHGDPSGSPLNQGMDEVEPPAPAAGPQRVEGGLNQGSNYVEPPAAADEPQGFREGGSGPALAEETLRRLRSDLRVLGAPE